MVEQKGMACTEYHLLYTKSMHDTILDCLFHQFYYWANSSDYFENVLCLCRFPKTL